MCGGVNCNMFCSAGSRRLKFERGISTRRAGEGQLKVEKDLAIV